MANDARTSHMMGPLPIYDFHEERLIWSQWDPVLGDARGAILDQLRLARLWSCDIPSQGLLIRSALAASPTDAKTILDACKAFRSLQSDVATKYAALATSVMGTSIVSPSASRRIQRIEKQKKTMFE